MVIHGYIWLSMVTSGYTWLSMAMVISYMQFYLIVNEQLLTAYYLRMVIMQVIIKVQYSEERAS